VAELDLLIILIAVSVVLVRLADLVQIPYPIVLVIAGIGIGFAPIPTEIELRPEVIFLVFLPPLLYAAGLTTSAEELKTEAGALGGLVVGLTLATMAAVAAVSVALIPGFTWLEGFLLGAIVCPTDPVAAVATFARVGVPKRVAVLVEGESLINDGVAVVLFTLTVAAAGSAAVQPRLLDGLFEFVRVAGGGILVGLATGFIAAQIVSRLDDRLVETTLSMALAFGSFVAAQSLGVSGILAVLTAGLVIGSLDLQKLSPTTRITLYNFWDLLAFVANSAVFLILGLQIDVTALLGHVGTVVVAVLAILASRAIVVYGMAWLSSRGRDPIPMRYRHVMFWGGLRGAVSLALALSLTGPRSGDLQLMTFGVVLFTLLVQGLTIEPLIKRLGLSNLTHTAEQQHQLARLLMLRASRRELDTLHHEGLLAQPAWRAISDMAEEDMQAVLHQHPELERRILVETRQELLRAKRNALAEALHRGVIGEEVYQQEVGQLDRQILVWERFDEYADRPQPGDAST